MFEEATNFKQFTRRLRLEVTLNSDGDTIMTAGKRLVDGVPDRVRSKLH